VEIDSWTSLCCRLPPQLPDQGENALPDEQGEDAVDPPGEVPAKEEHVEKRRHVRTQENGAPEHDLLSEPLGERPDHAEQRIVEKRHRNRVDDQEDDWINAIVVASRLHECPDLGDDELDHFLQSPFIQPVPVAEGMTLVAGPTQGEPASPGYFRSADWPGRELR